MRRGERMYGGRGDTDETGDGTATEPDGRPFPLESVVDQHPGQSSAGRREVRDDPGDGCSEHRTIDAEDRGLTKLGRLAW